MFKSIRFGLVVLGLMIGAIGNAQKITEGVFEYGLISYEINKDSVDELVTSVIKQLESIPDIKFYFTPNRLSLSTPDLVKKNMRAVIDLETHQEYNFTNISGVESFIINEGEPDYSKPIIIGEEYGEGKKLDKQIYGFTCTEYTSTHVGTSAIFVTTNDILIPDSTKLTSMLTNNGFLVRTKTTDDNLGISFTIGIKSFSPIIPDRDILSIDTIGMTNMSNARDEFLKVIRERKE